jgi:5-methylcytosine-specific restriction endonuclease McrA
MSKIQYQTDQMTVLDIMNLFEKKREQILYGLLATLFQRKDAARLFSTEQRRILWNSSETRRCATCRKVLTWEDFTVDHIKPHSKGGATALENAGLMCKRHNSAKGNRRTRLAA